MYDLILCFITAFTFSLVALPSIIYIAKVKGIMDIPDERRVHDEPIPSLGGIAIFAGIIFSIIMWTPFDVFGDLQYILCSMLVLYMIGFRDDIIPMDPKKKFLGQLLAAFILVVLAKVQIPSFFGLLGIEELPYFVRIVFSIFVVVVIVNAFNLIDGINGLSSGLTILICTTFGYWFAAVGRMELALLSVATIGSLVAFLKYNLIPAKIFMGDTGSLLCGLVSSILAIEFIEMHALVDDLNNLRFNSVPIVAFGVLIIPLFDTLRVFLLRIMKGKSPFYPDKTHLHHLLLQTGLNHIQSTIVLVSINFAFILLVFLLQDLGGMKLLGIVLASAIFISLLLEYIARVIRAKKVNH